MNVKAFFKSLLTKSGVAQGPISALFGLTNAVWTKKDYVSLSKEGFKKCLAAYRSITDIAQSVASVPPKLEEVHDHDEKEEIFDHPILDLLNRPDPVTGRSAFMVEMMSYLQIDGNSFTEGIGPDTGPNRDLFQELHNQRPDRVKVIPGNGIPASYELWVGGTHKKTWDVDPVTGESDILQLKLFNPLDDWRGMSPIEASAKEIDIRNAFNEWNAKLLQNDARPGGVLTSEKKLNDKQFQRYRQQLNEHHAGAAHAGEAMLIEGGMTWTQYGFSPKDMEWILGRDKTAADIAIAFGYPPILLNIGQGATYANAKEARLFLWQNTVIPYLRHIQDELNHWLVARWAKVEGRKLYLSFDLTSVPALAEVRNSAWDRLAKAKGVGTINEIRALVGWDTYEGGDVIMTSAADIPLGEEPDEEDAEKAKFIQLLLQEGYTKATALEMASYAFRKTQNRKTS